MERRSSLKESTKRYNVFDRTCDPKYANYFGDGSGRDTYVVLNNGGLLNSDK